VSVNRRRS